MSEIKKMFDRSKKDYFQFGAVMDGAKMYRIYSYTFQMNAMILCQIFDIEYDGKVYGAHYSIGECERAIEILKKEISLKMYSNYCTN